MPCPIEPILSPDVAAAAANTAAIQAIVQNGGHARIPAGIWPVKTVMMASRSRISGCGRGLSELKLIGGQTALIRVDFNATSQVTVNDITLNGDFQQALGVSNVLLLAGCRDSLFYNLEIKNAWTNGILVCDFINAANPSVRQRSQRILFRNCLLQACGQNAVKVESGEELVFNALQINRVGRDLGSGSAAAQHPKSALNVTPQLFPGTEAPMDYVRSITFADCQVHMVGSGLIQDATHAAQPATSMVVAGLTMSDIQTEFDEASQTWGVVWLARQITDFTASDVIVRDFVATAGPTGSPLSPGVMFQDSTGTVSNLAMIDLTGSRFPLHVLGNAAQMQMSNVLVETTNQGVLLVGPQPQAAGEASAADSAALTLSQFRFQNVTTLGNFVTVRNNSLGFVRLFEGTIRDLNAVPNQVVVQLDQDAEFEGCDFEFPIEEPARNTKLFFGPGRVIGSTNNWNRQYYILNSSQTSQAWQAQIKAQENGDIFINNKSRWSGNEIIVRDDVPGTPSSTSIQVFFPGSPVNGPTQITTRHGALLARTDGTTWYTNRLGS